MFVTPRWPGRFRFWAWALSALLLAGPAAAVPYEVEIDVQNEQDLYELYSSERISQDSLDTLVDLIQQGVDLNSSNREELYELPDLTYAEVDALLRYRAAAGKISELRDLVLQGIWPAEKLTRLAPFLTLGGGRPGKPVSGRVRTLVGYTGGEAGAPPGFLQARLQGPYGFQVGALIVTTRHRLGEVAYDVGRDALSVQGPAYRVQAPKLFAVWSSDHTQVVVGSFRLGFGERLTLDNTHRQAPDGVYPDDVVLLPQSLQTQCRLSSGELADAPCSALDRAHYVGADFSWRDGFRGVAASIGDISLGTATAVVHAFGSYQRRSVYQYELFDPRRCADPRQDVDPACAAPEVFLRQPDPASPSPHVTFSTLPDLYDEVAAGGNANLSLSPTVQVGVTGYYARPLWRTGGPALDFQEYNPTPFGGPTGALGIDGSLGVGPWNLFLELTRSFDSIPGGGGGFAAVERSAVSFDRQELELSLRYFGRTFKNLYARPISAPDEFDGARAGNEAGGRARYLSKAVEGWQLRGEADFWVLPGEGSARGTAGQANLNTFARADFTRFKVLQPGLMIEYRNKDLGRGGFGQCFDVPFYQTNAPDPVVGPSPLVCTGDRYRASARLRYVPTPKLALELDYTYSLLDDPHYLDRFRQDSLAWVEAVARPIEPLRLRARTRDLIKAIDDDTYLERSLWTFVEAGWTVGPAVFAQLRYDLYAYLDHRPATLLRTPSPEHRLRLEVEVRF